MEAKPGDLDSLEQPDYTTMQHGSKGVPLMTVTRGSGSVEPVQDKDKSR